MKLQTIVIGAAMYILLWIIAPYAESRYVEIKKSFAPVYEFLDPKSKIVIQAKKGEYYELIYEGTSWYQIKAKGKIGWLERGAGNVVKGQGITIFSIPVGTFLFFLLLLIATVAGASFLIYKQKTAEI